MIRELKSLYPGFSISYRAIMQDSVDLILFNNNDYNPPITYIGE